MSESDHLKRLALQIAAQLPEEEGSALYVLEVAREIVHHLGEAAALVPLASQPAERLRRTLRLVPRVDAATPIDHPGISSLE